MLFVIQAHLMSLSPPKDHFSPCKAEWGTAVTPSLPLLYLRGHFLEDRGTNPANSIQEGRIQPSVPRTGHRDSSGMAFPALTNLLLPAWSSPVPPGVVLSRARLQGELSLLRPCPWPWPELGAAEGSRAGLGAGWSWDVLGLSL